MKSLVVTFSWLQRYVCRIPGLQVIFEEYKIQTIALMAWINVFLQKEFRKITGRMNGRAIFPECLEFPKNVS